MSKIVQNIVEDIRKYIKSRGQYMRKYMRIHWKR